MIHQSSDLIPEKLEDWLEETVKNILELKYEENEILEFKEKFFDRDKEFKRKTIDIITSFANSSGGFIIFGITDKHELKGINLDERTELNLQISQILENVMPKISFDTKKVIISDKSILILKILESNDKPIQSQDKAFYIRVAGQTLPISRDYLRDMFLTKDIKNQKLEALKFEIDYMNQIIEELGDKFAYSPVVPPFYKFRLDEIQRTISDYRGYFKEGFNSVLKEITKYIVEIKKEEKFYNFKLDIEKSRGWGSKWADLEGFFEHNKIMFGRTNNNLDNQLRLLKHFLKELEKYI